MTDDPDIVALRERQIRNFVTLLMLSRGVPMILAGDEMGRSQGGNNNAYCQDNNTSWLDWGNLETNQGLHRFFHLLIAFRNSYGLLRHNSYVPNVKTGVRIDWHGFQLEKPDWSDESRSLAMHLHGTTSDGPGDTMYLMANADTVPHQFELPAIGFRRWRLFIDTALNWENAIVEPENMIPLEAQHTCLVEPRSVIVLVASEY